MMVATLSSKGQITLPAAARRMLGFAVGDRLAIETRDMEIVVRRAHDFFALDGFLGRALPREVERTAMLKGVSGKCRK
ncbi:MAG: AbrB/MazE/SpoVT family DNA-binding domain-containing protein [Kiritimatiellia bacterium]